MRFKACQEVTYGQKKAHDLDMEYGRETCEKHLHFVGRVQMFCGFRGWKSECCWLGILKRKARRSNSPEDGALNDKAVLLHGFSWFSDRQDVLKRRDVVWLDHTIDVFDEAAGGRERCFLSCWLLCPSTPGEIHFKLRAGHFKSLFRRENRATSKKSRNYARRFKNTRKKQSRVVSWLQRQSASIL